MDYKKKYLKYKKKYFRLKYGGMHGSFGDTAIVDCEKEFEISNCTDNKAILKTIKKEFDKKQLSTKEFDKKKKKKKKSAIRQLKNECTILKKLDNKNDHIISLYKCDNTQLLIEYSSIGSLRENLNELKNKNVDKISIINGLIDGLIYLHENEIIHRDIKPENIVLFRKNGILYPKYIDFGISNTKGIFNGTPGYMNNYLKNKGLYDCKNIIDNSKQDNIKNDCYKKYDNKILSKLPILRDYYGLGCVIFEIIYGIKYQVKINGKPTPLGDFESNNNRLLEFILNLLKKDNFILTKIKFEEKDLPINDINITDIISSPTKIITTVVIPKTSPPKIGDKRDKRYMDDGNFNKKLKFNI